MYFHSYLVGFASLSAAATIPAKRGRLNLGSQVACVVDEATEVLDGGARKTKRGGASIPPCFDSSTLQKRGQIDFGVDTTDGLAGGLAKRGDAYFPEVVTVVVSATGFEDEDLHRKKRSADEPLAARGNAFMGDLKEAVADTTKQLDLSGSKRSTGDLHARDGQEGNGGLVDGLSENSGGLGGFGGLTPNSVVEDLGFQRDPSKETASKRGLLPGIHTNNAAAGLTQVTDLLSGGAGGITGALRKRDEQFQTAAAPAEKRGLFSGIHTNNAGAGLNQITGLLSGGAGGITGGIRRREG